MTTMQSTKIQTPTAADWASSAEFPFPGPLPDGTLPDPPRIPDMMQRKHFSRFDETLGPFFVAQGRTDIAVFGEAYVCFNTRARSALIPDCMVLLGVDNDVLGERNGVVIEEVGKPPDFVLEVASKSTGKIDYTAKREGYARYGIPEYWRFDETGGLYHDQPLAGDKLVNGVYEPIELNYEPDGVIWGHSEVLGLDLCWVESQLRFRHQGEYIPTPQEIWQAQVDTEAELADSQARSEAERAARVEAEAELADSQARSETERAARVEAEAELADSQARSETERAARLAAEDEVRRLREQLSRLNPDS